MYRVFIFALYPSIELMDVGTAIQVQFFQVEKDTKS